MEERIQYKRMAKDEFKERIEKEINEKISEGYKETIVNLPINQKLMYILEELKYNGKSSEDLDKVEFDLENINPFVTIQEKTEFDLIDDFHYIGFEAGGDWEHPVYFIIYIDQNSEVRGYIPEDGNIYNKKLKSAFGNNDEREGFSYTTFKYERIEYNDSDAAKEQFGLKDLEDDYFDPNDHSIDFDYEKMTAEIKSKLV